MYLARRKKVSEQKTKTNRNRNFCDCDENKKMLHRLDGRVEMREEYTKIICGECKHLILNSAYPRGIQMRSRIVLIFVDDASVF
jgi:hypothetical protein